MAGFWKRNASATCVSQPKPVSLRHRGEPQQKDHHNKSIEQTGHIPKGRSNIWSKHRERTHRLTRFTLLVLTLPALAVALALAYAFVIESSISASIQKLMDKIMHDQHTPVSRIRDDLPPGIDAVLDRMLNKKPENRFQNGRAVAVALRDCFSALET